jgi:hypothetical protein
MRLDHFPRSIENGGRWCWWNRRDGERSGLIMRTEYVAQRKIRYTEREENSLSGES